MCISVQKISISEFQWDICSKQSTLQFQRGEGNEVEFENCGTSAMVDLWSGETINFLMSSMQTLNIREVVYAKRAVSKKPDKHRCVDYKDVPQLEARIKSEFFLMLAAYGTVCQSKVDYIKIQTEFHSTCT